MTSAASVARERGHHEQDAATKHAVEGYSESLDHEVRTRGIRVSGVEPANTSTQFDANLLQPDSKLEEYHEARTAMAKRMTVVVTDGDQPGVIADAVLKAASADRPKLRYPAGAGASRLQLLRRFAPAGVLDAGIRKNLRLDAMAASLLRIPSFGEVVRKMDPAPALTSRLR